MVEIIIEAVDTPIRKMKFFPISQTIKIETYFMESKKGEMRIPISFFKKLIENKQEEVKHKKRSSSFPLLTERITATLTKTEKYGEVFLFDIHYALVSDVIAISIKELKDKLQKFLKKNL